MNADVQNDWFLNFKAESRQLIQREGNQVSKDGSFKYILSDLSLITAKNMGLNSRLAVGYLIRIHELGSSHRFIQQFAIVKKMSGFRLSHRFAADQTFSVRDYTIVRVRYRLSSEIPLNGRSVDPKEFYLKISNEYLDIFHGSNNDLEVRFVSFLGYDFTDDNKIEFGLDYRLNSFLINFYKHNFWLRANWYIDL